MSRQANRAADDWAALDELFDQALVRPPEARAAFLDRACAGRPALRRELEALLAAVDAEDGEDAWLERSKRAIRAVTREALAARCAGTNGNAGEAGAMDPSLPTADDPMRGRRIGAWKIVRRIGRGGMGNVYLAERADGEFEQQAALKLLRRGVDTDDILRRFLAERQILATLVHPHIAGLLDGGATEGGRPYFCLEYVPGEPITEYCERHGLGLKERLRLFVTVCRAVAHAHRNRVLHRDLKPSNIMVTGDGQVKLLDFGIAKLLDEPAGEHTRTGVRLMTPDYASPEQVRGEPVTAATDVYQLGTLLYELLTGHRPHRLERRSAVGIERTVCEEDPPPPSARVPNRRLRRRLRGELDAVTLQALRKEPERRYTSADAFAEDIERHLSGQAVRARRPTLAYRARKLARRHPAALAAAAVVLVLLLSVAGLIPGTLRTGPPVSTGPVGPVAIGHIEAGDEEAAAWTGQMRDMLATGLSGVPGMEVLSPPRVLELLTQLDAADVDSTVALRRAAREGGATALVEGSLRPTRAGFRLDLHWMDLETGRVQRTARVEDADIYRMAQKATAELARAHGLTLPAGRLSDVIIRSPFAHRLYEEGVRAYYEGDPAAARRLLTAALEEDSTFAMAAYYRALSREDVDQVAFRRDLIRAVRFADHASDRERLLIHTAWAREMDEPRQLALAETLAVRYPFEPDGHLFYGQALLWSGNFLGALPHLERVLVLDSASLGGESPRCRACDALRSRATAYVLADSLPAAEREARKGVVAQRFSARALHMLASTLEYQGRPEDALQSRLRAESRRADDPRDAVYPAMLALRAGDFERADRLLEEQERQDASLVQQNVLWFRTLSLMFRDRYEEALRVAREYRQMVLDAPVPAQRPPWQAVLEAQVLLEMGRARDAARLWREMAEYPYEPESASRTARHRAWTLTQLATALAAAGDTAALSGLITEVEETGRQSAYGRDPRLHHYVRGLLLAARGDTAGAIDAYRRAIFSRTAGYGRINLELGGLLLAAGGPAETAEAVEVLRGALRGPLDAGNLYLNRTDLHALLARAHRASGATDSAAAHARWVAAARSSLGSR